MLEVRRPIAHFRLLVLGVLPNMTPGGVHRNPWVTQTFPKKSFGLNLRKKSNFLALTFAFVPMKVDLITKEWSYKQGMVDASGVGGIKMIFAVLGPFLLVCEFGTNGLDLKEKIYTKYYHHLKVFLGVLGGSYGRDWTSCIAWYKFPYLEVSPRAFGLLYPTERGGAFLQEQKPIPLAAKLGNYRMEFDIVQLSFSKRAGWLIRFGEIRIVKERLFVPNLVTCYSERDAQREWIKLSYRRSREQKCKFLKRCANDFSQRIEEFRSRVKYRYRIIGRLISIKVL